MPRAEPTDRIRQLEESRARINAEIQRVKGRAQQAERKRETRRKILVGVNGAGPGGARGVAGGATEGGAGALS